MKKIVIFKGGLGNQIYQYGMYTYQQSILHQDVRYYYRESDHNGFELDKYFNTTLHEAPPFYKWLYELAWRLHKYHICRQFIQMEQEPEKPRHALFINGHWANKKYFTHSSFDLSFKQLPLSSANARVASMIKQPGSVAIHVRRGDYLLPQNRKIFNTLTADYYLHAIDYIRQHTEHPLKFFFFSDDIEWVKENIRVNDAEYIDWNKGDDSVYDMYLMSMASANIIANSSFSFWAARLNQNNPLVVYPKKWYAGDGKRDIFSEQWISL